MYVWNGNSLMFGGEDVIRLGADVPQEEPIKLEAVCKNGELDVSVHARYREEIPW